jgi:gluconokinase
MARVTQPLVLAVDVGTSSVRAMLHDGRGRPVPGADAHEPYRPRVAADGTAEVPAETLRRLVERSIDRVVAHLSGPVAAVGFSTFWHGLLGLDGRRPSTPVLLWSDSRSWPQADELLSRLQGDAVHQRTGCPLHPSYWPAKLAWARTSGRQPQRWCSFGDYLFLHWFGDLDTSLSMASGTGLLGLRRPGWDRELLDHLGVTPDQLPSLGAEPRRAPARLARRWPALAGALFVPPAGDGALANLGSGCTSPERRALTVGTSGALRAMTTELPDRLPEGAWCYRLDRERFVVGGSFSTGGNLHAWLIETLRLGGDELERKLRRMSPGEHGLVFLPLLAGERSPGFATHATGSIAGLTLATTGHDIARASLEGMAIDFATMDGRLDRAVPGGRLLVGGGAGLLRSPALIQILTDAIGKPLLAARDMEASARGAALFALEQVGVRVADQPAGRTFEPRPDAHAAYQQLGELHRALYVALVGKRPGVGQPPPAHLRAGGSKDSNGG